MSKKKAKKKKTEFTGEVTMTRAIRIFEALGFKTANKWDMARLQKKIQNLPVLADGTKLPEKRQRQVNLIVKALEKGQKVTVVDVDDQAAGNQREKAVQAAGKRAAEKRALKRSKAAKTNKSKSEKKAKKTAKKKGPKKPGVIASILEFIKSNGPVSKKKILSLLTKRFPDRPVDGMEKTINAQLPNRMSKEKGVKIKVDDKGRFSIKK